MTDLRPAPADPRILSLDAIRGVAVMGIFAMNVLAFALPAAAYTNPLAYGGRTPADLATWVVGYLLFDGKMRGLFSFLFGASTLLVIDRAQAGGERAAKVHFSRMAWLFVFGMLHLTLLWWGDILNHYALVGCLAWFFRRKPPHRLIGIGVLLLILETAMLAGTVWQMGIDQAAVAAGHPSSDALAAFLADRANFGVPSAAVLARDIAVHRSGYAAIFADRLPAALAAPGQALMFLAPETLAYMLFGMAALKSGLLTGDWSRTAYARLAAAGFGFGIAGYALVALLAFRHGFSMLSVAASNLIWSEPFRPPMIVAWASLVILLLRSGGGLTTRVAAAGRMAFSNYIATTLIATTLFYGYGFGLYGRLSRAELWWVVLGMAAAMLGWSRPWLARFRYGPLEWLWRSLARGRAQPMRRLQ